MFRRVKRYLTPSEYFSLDKRNREVVVEGGEVLRAPTHDDLGRELPDPVPLAPPIGFVNQPSMFDVMRDMIRGEALKAYAESTGSETFEEAQDFDVEDDMFPQSSFEGEFDPMEDLKEKRDRQFRQRFIEEETNASYREWRDRVLAEREQQGSPLSRMARAEPGKVTDELVKGAKAAKPRSSSKPPQPAGDEE